MNPDTMWHQEKITLQPKSRGFHLVTDEIVSQLKQLGRYTVGLAHLHILHTSAGLTLNENADPDVRRDFETHFNRMVPEDPGQYRHTLEGTDDMTSHIKSSLLGHGLTLPVTDGRFHLGTWQGIYLCEHRNRAGARSLVATLTGEAH